MKMFGAAMVVLALVAGAVMPVAPAAADTRVVISGGDDCCWGPRSYHHHYYSDRYPGWGRPIYVVPPPVVYAPPPVIAYPAPPPPMAYAAPVSGGVNAAPISPVFVDRQGRSCREYQTSVVVGGVSKPAFGTACQQPDGTWRIVQ